MDAGQEERSETASGLPETNASFYGYATLSL